jgi:endonuclease YncB( thermonuclease family)
MNTSLIFFIKYLSLLLLLPLISSCLGNSPKNNTQLTENYYETKNVAVFSKTDTTKIKQLEVKIIRILDGDTVEMLYGQLPIKLRLQHIDCPEKRGKQPFGNKAKQTLSDLCFGQTVTIHSDVKFDRNGRLIGVIFTKEGLNVNKEMLRLGMAWHYKKYSDDMSYDVLEKEARKAKVGLWSEPKPIPPWDYR